MNRRIKQSRIHLMQSVVALITTWVLSTLMFGCVTLTKQLEKDYNRKLTKQEINKSWRN